MHPATYPETGTRLTDSRHLARMARRHRTRSRKRTLGRMSSNRLALVSPSQREDPISRTNRAGQVANRPVRVDGATPKDRGRAARPRRGAAHSRHKANHPARNRHKVNHPGRSRLRVPAHSRAGDNPSKADNRPRADSPRKVATDNPRPNQFRDNQQARAVDPDSQHQRVAQMAATTASISTGCGRRCHCCQGESQGRSSERSCSRSALGSR
jgi:hypothetical protein